MAELLKSFRKRDAAAAVIALCFIVAQVWLDLRLPDYMSRITLLVQTPGSEMQQVLQAGGSMLLCALGSLVSSVLVAVCAARIATDFGSGLRARLFRKVQSFSMAEIGKFSTASLITRTGNDVMQVQMLIVMGLQSMIKAPIMAAWAIAKISGKGSAWSAATAVSVAIIMVGVAIVIKIALPRFRSLQKLTDDLNRITRENLSGLKVVRAYNAQQYQMDKFQKANDTLTNTQLFVGRAMASLMPTIQLVMNGLTLSIYILGAIMINKAVGPQRLTLFSDMVVFTQYAMQVVMSFMMLVMIFIILPRAQVSAKRIAEVLRQPLSIKDGPGAESTGRGEVEFKNVSFRYPEAEGDAIHGISFKAQKGETVAFIGATGCGKSTLINLVPRFYDATEGEVLVDGVNVKEYSLDELRGKIGYVPQKAQLFRGSVIDNITFGSASEPVARETAEAAVAVAQAKDFVENMQDGYQSEIAQGGGNLSGGQKQRLSIARAIAREPEILIFDDSFSALDYKTDRTLRKALQQQYAGTTKLIVAQRVGTIMDADRIIVLEDGEIAGVGTHRELLEQCDVYRQIAGSQLSKEELAGGKTE